MKHYVLIHNLIMQARATITNSVEKYNYSEKDAVARMLENTITEFDEELTSYQIDNLNKLVDEIRDC